MTLQVAHGLVLPADAVTQTFAILARKGAGKTYTCSTPGPSGFTDRTLGDPAVWKQQASFEENFPTLAPRGKFLEDLQDVGAPTPSTT